MAVSRVLQEEFSNLEWERVSSSNVEGVAYVPYAKRMWVRFLPKPGSRHTVYVYLDVDRSTYDAIRTADSVGSAVHRLLKKTPTGYIPVF